MKTALCLGFALLLSVPLHSQQADKNAARMDQIASDYYTRKQFMGAVLVAQGDHILFEKDYGYANLEWNTPFALDAKFRIGSMTKQFTAASILLLQERSRLKTSDLISRYLENTPSAWSKITIRNLLTHTSGIPNFTSVPDYGTKIALLPTTPEKEYASFRDKPLDFQPGEKFAYSNSNYILLGMIIEKVGFVPYGQFLRDNIFAPLHMNDSGIDSNTSILHHRVYGYTPAANNSFVNADYSDMTVPFAAGAIYSTTHDLLKWNLALYGGHLLKPASLAEMTTAYKGEYAYGLFVKEQRGRKSIEHGGGIEGFNTYLCYYPPDQLTVVVLGNVNGKAPDEIAEKLASVEHDEPVVLPSERKEVQVAPSVLAQYVGTYSLTPAFSITITLDRDHLVEQATNQQPFPLFAESQTKFFLKVVDAEIEFFRNANGQIDHLVLRQNGREITGAKQ